MTILGHPGDECAKPASDEDSESARLGLSAQLTAPCDARHFTKQTLRRWQAQPEAIETAELLSSEIVTNAIKATEPATDHLKFVGPDAEKCISLTLWRLPGRVLIEVSDANPNPPVLSEADADAEAGRGLLLIQVLSERWGYRYSPSGGKVVYAVITTNPPLETSE